ncbi:hypothetical protein LTR01_000093 [Friedmanniomyces endolithicus]|nr:hypothetical protein LTR01_000093 [Friedmanniomyces endolithicus]KAK0834521.1 hypothetical protein LTR73_000809 [Friedmanniomyces endolithicus]
MAKISSSARPASRQGSNAPQGAAPTAPPLTTTRTTRSQSREPDERRTAQRSVDTQKKIGKVTRGLGTVTENGTEEKDHEALALAAEQEAALSTEAGRRESGYSGISGTTAKTSFSQEEIADLDPDTIIDVLPDLAKDASKVASLLVGELVDYDASVQSQVWKDIRTTGSRHNKRYTHRLDSLDVHKRNFGSQEYIQPSIVSRALLGVHSIGEVPTGPWRPDNILFLVNMAQMLRLVLVSDPAEFTQEVYNSLELLDAHFMPCIAGSPDREALRLLLTIQTQLVIVRLSEFQNVPQFDPMDVITDSFFKRDADGELMYKDAEALQLAELANQQILTTVTRLVHKLKAPFKEGKPIVEAVAQLRSKHKWAKFVDEIINYYVHRSAQVDQEIAAAGGLEEVIESMSRGIQRREDARLAAMKRQSFASSGPTKGFGKSAIANMKAREKRVSEMSDVAAVASAPTGRAPVVPSMNPRLAATEAQAVDDWAPPPVEEVEDQPPAQRRVGSTLDMSGFRNLQAQNAKKAKAPVRFLDHQEDAADTAQHRGVLPDEGATFRLPGRSSASSHMMSSSAPAKRPFARMDDEPEEFEPTQDTGFQLDTRDTTAADARRRLAPRPIAQMRPRTLPASSHSLTADYNAPAPTSASAGLAKKQRKNPGSTIPPPLPNADPEGANIPREHFYPSVKVLARQSRIGGTQGQRQQVRTPWTEDEEYALLQLIEEHCANGIRYADLKTLEAAEGNVLGRRSAEDMRFKARNMKLNILLARTALPENFDYVKLDRKMIEKLQERGVGYEL